MRPNCKPASVGRHPHESCGWLWAARQTAAALLLILATAASARAAVVLKKGLPQPILGHLVRQDDRVVVVREELPAGGARELIIPRDQIDELIITVDPARLAALNPARPKVYREYAEELAEKHRDPEAAAAARRLYAIAAARGDGPLRKGALLGLVALARSSADERRLRAAAFLFAEPHDAALLTKGALAPPATANPPPGELLAALRLIRQGRGAEAKTLLELPLVRQGAAAIGDVITVDELLAAAAARALSDVQLSQILRAELTLSGAAASADATRPAAWSQTVKAGQLAPLPELRLESLTEFDPAECVFRDGKWTRP